jgi:hypothetical protein
MSDSTAARQAWQREQKGLRIRDQKLEDQVLRRACWLAGWLAEHFLLSARLAAKPACYQLL